MCSCRYGICYYKILQLIQHAKIQLPPQLDRRSWSKYFFWYLCHLLKVKDKSKYLQLCSEIEEELKIYENMKTELKMVDEETKIKICNIRIMISGFNGDEKSNNFVYKWARWLRKDQHIARCSNHAEGSHGNINSSIDNHGSSNFSTSLSVVINYILN